MYKSFTAAEYRKHFDLDQDYTVEGFLIFGNYREELYDSLKESLGMLGYNPDYRRLPNDFLANILVFKIDGKNYWFVVAYGGALLSEYLHLACLFGSKKNILLGSCGGLKKGGKAEDIIIPTWSFAEESSAKAYQPNSENRYYPNEELSKILQHKLQNQHTVYREPTITFQAMLGETEEDVRDWSEQGYGGVEMEAATVFATSNHFKKQSAAILRIADNMIEGGTTLDEDYQNTSDNKDNLLNDMFEAALTELIDK